jgi:hypothetical protein
VEDVLLNYRLQALTETQSRPAFAPRFSLILPTGDEKRGLGNGRAAYQFNLPCSKIVHDRWTAHANAGLTFRPDVGGRDLLDLNFGASVIYAVTENFNFLLEWVGVRGEETTAAGVEHHFAHVILPGARYAFNLPDDAQLVVGLGAPIGLSAAAPDFGVFVYVSFEHFFQRK